MEKRGGIMKRYQQSAHYITQCISVSDNQRKKIAYSWMFFHIQCYAEH